MALTLEDIEILTGDVMSPKLHYLLAEAAYSQCCAAGNYNETKFNEELLKIIMANRMDITKCR